MDLRKKCDRFLLTEIKYLVQSEREVIVKVLHHLKEIERRRLFSDLGYSSLFDYAVRELKYSEGQASRRISGMRLIKEMPELEEKIVTGKLSLSNMQQAQSLFREMNADQDKPKVQKNEKLAILERLEDKSVREAQKELLALQPESALPKERERSIKDDITEVKFLVSDKLKAKLEEVRSLLGVKGVGMN